MKERLVEFGRRISEHPSSRAIQSGAVGLRLILPAVTLTGCTESEQEGALKVAVWLGVIAIMAAWANRSPRY